MPELLMPGTLFVCVRDFADGMGLIDSISKLEFIDK
jgi:hypothetical protein